MMVICFLDQLKSLVEFIVCWVRVLKSSSKTKRFSICNMWRPWKCTAQISCWKSRAEWQTPPLSLWSINSACPRPRFLQVAVCWHKCRRALCLGDCTGLPQAFLGQCCSLRLFVGKPPPFPLSFPRNQISLVDYRISFPTPAASPLSCPQVAPSKSLAYQILPCPATSQRIQM